MSCRLSQDPIDRAGPLPEGFAAGETGLGKAGVGLEDLARRLEQHPDDFDGWMKLLAIQVSERGQSHAADQTVKQVLWSGCFTSEQKAQAEVQFLQLRASQLTSPDRSLSA